MPTLRSKLGEWELPSVHRWSERGPRWVCEKIPLVSRDTKVATIGSCFAQELARVMAGLGVDGATHPGGIFYTSRTIRQELERLFVPGACSLDDEPFWKTQGGWVNPLREYERSFPTEAAARQSMARQTEIARNLFRGADLVVVTLGLIEGWWQPERNVHYRSIPHPDIFDGLGAVPIRLTYRDVVDDLAVIREIVRTRLGAELLLTVSPIPLAATVTCHDVRVANAESKARIRAAVSEFVEMHPDVRYFHSYEIVTSSEVSSDFMLEDGRHVRGEGVDYIVANFLQQFGVPGSGFPEPDSSFLSPVQKTAERVDLRSPRDKIRHARRRVQARLGIAGETLWSSVKERFRSSVQRVSNTR